MDITKFGLQNFRVFKEHFEFDLAPIMVLTGPNNSGKSSVSKALLLLKENEYKINSGWEFGIKKLNYFKGEHELGNHKLTVNTKGENTYFSFTFFKNYKFQIQIDNSGSFTANYIITGKDDELIIAQTGCDFHIIVTPLIHYFYDRLAFACSEECHESLVSKINTKKIEEVIHQLLILAKNFWQIDLDIISDFDWQVRKWQVYKDDSVIKEIEEKFENGILTKLSYEEDEDGPPPEYEGEWQELLIFLFKKITSVELTTEEIQFLVPTSSNVDFFKFSGLIYVNALKEPLKKGDIQEMRFHFFNTL